LDLSKSYYLLNYSPILNLSHYYLWNNELE
jgi:hypothetical protein